jgi:hypothetical protein
VGAPQESDVSRWRNDVAAGVNALVLGLYGQRIDVQQVNVTQLGPTAADWPVTGGRFRAELFSSGDVARAPSPAVVGQSPVVVVDLSLDGTWRLVVSRPEWLRHSKGAPV